jgi:hypothetical protein
MADPIYATAGSNYGFDGTPAEVVSDVFNAAWDQASSKSATSSNFFSAALSEGTVASSMAAADLGFIPSVIEPLVDIPTTAAGATVEKFEEYTDLVIDKLSGLFAGYLSTYFPDERAVLGEAEAWLTQALTTGGTGLAPAIEDQIWQRDRARLLAEASRISDELVAAFAARGFPLPPGALLHQQYLVQRDTQDKIAQSSREAAIKAAEMELDNIRFAVQQAVDLYKAAMANAADYIKALSIGPQVGMQIVPSVTDSQSRLISAASEYYRARIGVEELKLKAKLPDAEWEQAARIKNGDWVMEMVKNRVSAAIEAARGLSTQAAAALNGLHASVSVGASASNSVGYSYSGDTSGEAPVKTAV